MECLVLSSFEYFPTQPPINTPFITAFLKKNGINSTQLDMNIEVWDYLLSPGFIKELTYNSGYSKYCDELNVPNMNFEEFNYKKNYLLSSIDTIKSYYRNKEIFYDTYALAWANERIREFKYLFYYSYGILVDNLKTTYSFDNELHFSFSGMDNFSSDNQSNPFIRIFENILSAKLKDSAPPVILIEALYAVQFPHLATLTKVLKRLYPNSHICFSGFGFDQLVFARIKHSLKNNHLSFLGFDSIFMVRNDHALLSLVNHILNGKEINTIQSLAVNCQSTDNIINEKPLYEQYTKQSVLPDYEDIEFNRYFSPHRVIIERYSNRCYWYKCNYCSINAFKGRNVSLTKDEFLLRINTYYEKYEVNHIFLLDEAATPDQAREIAESFGESPYEFIWSLRTRIDKGLDKETLQLMYDSGCRELWMGLESPSPTVLNLMNKTKDPVDYVNQVRRIIQMASEIGIGLHFCLLFGFPGETIDDHEITLNFFKDEYKPLKRIPCFISFNVFFLTPFSKVWKEPEFYNIKITDVSEDRCCMDDIEFSVSNQTALEREKYFESINNTILEISNILSPNKKYLNLWESITDSCLELLFKEHFQTGSPFFDYQLDKGKVAECYEQFNITFVDNESVVNHWSEIEMAFQTAFENSEFIDSFTVSRPAEHSLLGATGKLGRVYEHILAKSDDGKIIGGLFCIPKNRKQGEFICDLGWFFTSPDISHINRIKVGDKIMELVHERLKDRGFTHVITEMGTQSGANYMARRFNYVHEPVEGKINRWMKVL
ncbi:radical SAM protein [Cytobacillus massiliigabonensis]|uniref:radical SAM protein n=1 Tax=Cytobacillus massiliigabonensis TaxID=1871011 RepID=UPI000C84CAAA|nr:radical SAM protein [Cytobacillus massiliigabonensis]